jgi:GNAT superfamily N-acetyltransferase
MEIQKLNAEALDDLISSKKFAGMENIPISRHRALSQLKNPALRKEDILLFIAWDDNRMAGYLGILPDDIYLREDNSHIGWMSCLWIAPDQRGKGIARRLLAAALEAWDNKLIATEFTAEAVKLYKSSGAFVSLTTLRGIRLYLRFDLHSLLPARKPSLKKFKPLLHMSDRILNLFNEARLAVLPQKKDFSIGNIQAPDQEIIDFIENTQPTKFCKGGAERLEWIRHNPWILQEGQDPLSSKYYFSAVDRRFEFRFFKITDTHGKLIAVLLLSIRNRHLKIPYAWLQEKELWLVCKAITAFMMENKLATATIYHPLLSVWFRDHKGPFLYKKDIIREYLISSYFQNKLPEDVYLQAGDGDCAFT